MALPISMSIGWPAGASAQAPVAPPDGAQATAAGNAPPPIELSLVTTLTVSDNGALAAPGLEQRDVFLSVRPAMSITHSAAGLKAKGELGADFVASKNDTRPDEILPFAQIRADATLIDNLFFVDASADVRQLETDAFGARVVQGSTQNSSTAAALSVSPYVLRDLTPDVSLLGRGDASWSRYGGDRSLDTQANQFALRLSAKPRPLGGLVEATAQDVNYPNASVNDWRLGMFSAGPAFSVASEFVVGIVGGVEQTTTTLANHTDSILGARFLWLPTQRTDVVLDTKHRFFGNSWNLSIQHRTATMSVALRSICEPLVPGSLAIGGTGSLTTFLDAILKTRFPDPNQRQQLVSALVSTRGLQTAVQGTAGAPANYAQLGKGAEATVVLLTPRNALSASVYQQTVTQLTRSDGEPAFVGLGEQDNRQVGLTLGLNRRLTPQTSVDLTARLSRVEGLSAREGDETREATYQLSAARSLAPRTMLTFGAQHRRLRSNVVSQTSFDETSAFVAIGHRF